MNDKELIKEFNKYLDCKLELYPKIIKVNNKETSDIYNEILFRNEFTFDNWLNNKINKHEYKTGFKTIDKPKIFNEVYNCDNKLLYGYSYKIYRFINYDFKLNVINV